MLSTPTAIWETTRSPEAAPAAKTSSSIGSRRVVTRAAIPERTFSRTSAFGGGWTWSWTSTSHPRSRKRSRAAFPMSQVA